MNLKLLLCIGLLAISIVVNAQVTLKADGPGDTYELINSVLAPMASAVESPECVHPEFGRHITEVWDAELKKYVFEFYIHVTPDNDRCVKFDRQRIEIKTYAHSADRLKGVVGETIHYRWKFRLPVGFQPSRNFTHIHQIKAVGGDDRTPLFSLTVRQGSPDRLELIHNNSTKLQTIPLSLVEGKWVECDETVTVGKSGTYSLKIRSLTDDKTLLTYNHNKLMTIRPGNDYIRPKWGVYRSLKNPASLRDEAVRFADFSIQELPN